MWNYIKPYLPYAFLAAVFMVGEVLMDLLQPGIMSRIVDEGVLGLDGGGPNLTIIWRLGIAMAVLVLFGGFCGSMNNVFVHMSGQNIGNDIRKDCFRNIMNFSFSQTDQFGSGTLITRVTNDITQVQNFVSQFVRGMIRTSMLMFGSIFFMFRLNRTFGLIVLCAFPFLIGCLAFCLVKANPLFVRLQDQLDSINEILQEDVGGIRIIKACVREAWEKLRFGRANDALTGTQLRILMIFAFMNPAVNGLMYLVTALLLLAGRQQNAAHLATPGTIMAAITYTTQLLNGILMLVMLFQNISRGYASWKRIRELLHVRPQMKDGDVEQENPLTGEIRFDNVSFSYPGSSQPVLKNVSFTIHPGETVAVMGATGCGKSTLANLIPRFYDVTSGSVKIDGKDVREYRQRYLRDNISMALQKSELFGTSVRENIAWGNPLATDEEIRQAARIAQADEFITALPRQYQTVLAERGSSLSGGQKQRLSMARAVLKPAPVLILDDATSALDLKTETNLYHALDQARPDTTRIVIAQRVASARRADRILVLNNGTVAACGTHQELMESCEIYRDICQSQLGSA